MSNRDNDPTLENKETVSVHERKAIRLQAGDQIDHFHLLRLLGEGGMGSVYLARDLKLGRKVALKFLRSGTKRGSNTVQRQLQEARTIARFNHAHIVTIHEVGEHDGFPYLALEYVNGESLRKRSGSRRLGYQEVIRIGIAIASALAEAHRHGILHLDLKPENVVIPQDGRLRVLDFGLARSASLENALSATLRPTKRITGTPQYMAPEQWAGASLTKAVDVWALGIMLYELVQGQHPYADEEADLERLAAAVKSTAVAPQLHDNELQELVAQCLDKDPRQRPEAHAVETELRTLLKERPTTDAEIKNPFRGLQPFLAQHAGLFFGRQREIDELVERLESEPILPVVGASGAGKSSFVHAGVIPRLMEQGNWLVFSFRPGLDPFKSLAACLFSSGSSVSSASPSQPRTASETEEIEALLTQLNHAPESLSICLERLAEKAQARVLVVVDQLEEVYTLGHDTNRQSCFIRALTSAADDALDPVRVIFTVRDDFLYRLGTAGPEVRRVLRRMMLLQAPDRDGLIETLIRPVEDYGYRYEAPYIVQDMVDAIKAQSSGLPLLQFAAYMLWERRDQTNKRLTKDAYRDLGGVAGVLARHADAVLERVLQVDLVREIVLRLVTSEGTRRVALRDEILEEIGDGTAEVLDALISARLITTVRIQTKDKTERGIELAHESLIHSWHRLRGWLDSQKEELRFLTEAREAAELWIRRGRPSNEVWTGGALIEAHRMLDRCISRPPKVVREFLEQGASLERRRKLRQLCLVGFIVISSVLTSSVLFIQRRQAVQSQNQAEKQATSAKNASRIASAALHRSDPTLFLSLIREVEMQDDLSVEWPELAQWATQQTIAQMVIHQESVDASFSPDGTRLVIASGKTATIWNSDGSEPVGVLRGHQGFVESVAYSPDGTRILTASLDGMARIYSSDGSTLIRVFRHPSPIITAAFSPDGTRIVTASHDHTARIWQVNGESAPVILRGHRGKLSNAAFSPDGTRIVTASEDQTARVWSTESYDTLQVIQHQNSVSIAVFSPDGTRLLTAGEDRILRLWSTDAYKVERTLKGHSGGVWKASFSPDGRRIVSAAYDKTARVWNVDGSSAPIVLKGHQDYLLSANFSSDGTRVVTTANDHTTRIWNIEDVPALVFLRGHQETIYTAFFSPDGTRVVTASQDRTARVWTVDGSEPVVNLRGHDAEVRWASFHPNGKLVVTASFDRTARVWHTDGSKDPIIFPHPSLVWSAAFSPDGQYIVTGSYDGHVRLWKIDGSEAPLVWSGHTAEVYSVSFTLDGKQVISASYDHTIRIWNRDGSPSALIFKNHDDRVRNVALSPDGTRILTASRDKTARVWQLDRPRADGSLPFTELPHKHIVSAGQRAFSPDGTQVVTASDDKTLRIWNLEAPKAPTVLPIPELDAYSASFSPDGQHIISASHSGQNPTTGKMEYWATIWPTFTSITDPDDPALWTATRYCPPVKLRMRFLGVSEEEAEAQRRACQKRVSRALDHAQMLPATSTRGRR